jgi:hypothetical protein
VSRPGGSPSSWARSSGTDVAFAVERTTATPPPAAQRSTVRRVQGVGARRARHGVAGRAGTGSGRPAAGGVRGQRGRGDGVRCLAPASAACPCRCVWRREVRWRSRDSRRAGRGGQRWRWGVLENDRREAIPEAMDEEVLSSGEDCAPGRAPIADPRDVDRRSEENWHDAAPRCPRPRDDPLV